ncbi:MAG: DUF3280 domain-containing protein [Hyphomicrobiaceae bacterium]|nr:DUF3280 domain-containing protein [Hyphomicrobiaceae bacterium]
MTLETDIMDKADPAARRSCAGLRDGREGSARALASHRGLAALAAAAILVSSITFASAAGAAPRLIFFPFEMIDATQNASMYGMGGPMGLPTGPSDVETERLATISAALAKRIAADGRYELVPQAMFAADLAEKAPISKCNGCEDDIATKAGAEFALIATVEKLSDLLFNFNLYLRDVKAQKLTSVMSTTIQGSTDEAWLRGIRYLAERKLLTAGDAK